MSFTCFVKFIKLVFDKALFKFYIFVLFNNFCINFNPTRPAFFPTSFVFSRFSSELSSIPATPVMAPPTINPVINPFFDFLDMVLCEISRSKTTIFAGQKQVEA